MWGNCGPVPRDPPLAPAFTSEESWALNPRVGTGSREHEGTASEKQVGGMSSALHTGGGRGSMRNHTPVEIAAVAWGLPLGLVAVPQRARAQIVTPADEHGRELYINVANVRELRTAPGDRRPTLSYSPPIHRYVDARGVIHFTR